VVSPGHRGSGSRPQQAGDLHRLHRVKLDPGVRIGRLVVAAQQCDRRCAAWRDRLEQVHADRLIVRADLAVVAAAPLDGATHDDVPATVLMQLAVVAVDVEVRMLLAPGRAAGGIRVT
jgi:hypothetical protein